MTVLSNHSKMTYADLLLYRVTKSFFADGIRGTISMASVYFAAALANAFPRSIFLLISKYMDCEV